MKSHLAEIQTIFSLLHDGTITAFGGDRNLLKLQVSCPYIAERINNKFEYFIVELIEIELLSFDIWTKDYTPKCFIELIDIFQTDLEINSADIKVDKVILTLLQDDKDFDFTGGHLNLVCKSIRVLDQINRVMPTDYLHKIVQDYWDDWSNK